MVIKSAKDITLDKVQGNLPNVYGVITQWFIPMTVSTVVKTTVNYKVVETFTNYSFMGVLQPFGAKQLNQKPEGQRAWAWYQLHCDTSLKLDVDERMTYQGTKYRVKARLNFEEYGYLEYHLIEDYE